jgi:Putative peptidoglycan binding domain
LQRQLVLQFALLQAQTPWRIAAAVVVMVAAASVEEAFTAAASVVAVFEVVVFTAVLPVVVFAAVLPIEAFAVDFVAEVFAGLVFAVLAFEEASAGIGSVIETSTIGSSSLAILGTRSFTIPIHTTDTIPMAIILTVTGTSLTMSLFTKAGWDTATLWLEKSSSTWRVQAINHGSIDGVSGSKTRRAIRAYEHAHALPQDGRIDQRLLTTMELS